MEKVTASLGWKKLRKNQAWFLQVQPLWHTPPEYFLSGQGPFNAGKIFVKAIFIYIRFMMEIKSINKKKLIIISNLWQ